MSDTAAAQLQRILQLIPTLADDREHPLDRVAADAGVSLPTLLRDLKSLAERYDDPAGFIEGVQVFVDRDKVSVASAHFLRPMRLTLAELCALDLALNMLRQERPPEEHDVLQRAQARLRKVIARLPGDPEPEPVATASLAPADTDVLSILRSAVKRRAKLRIVYRKADGEDMTERLICPYAVVNARGWWYVVAFCELSNGLRVFRIDRIDDCQLTALGFPPPADFSLEQILRDGRVFIGSPEEMLRVWYSPAIARWIAEREGVPLREDGSLVLDCPLADDDWAVRHVLQYGPEAEVLAPQRIRSLLRQRLERMLTPED